MQWTSDPPTEAGWYWLDDTFGVSMVSVYASAFGDNFLAQQEGKFADVKYLANGRWYGPLRPPD